MTEPRLDDISEAERKLIWKRRKEGDAIDALATEFRRSRPRIRAVLLQMEREANATEWNAVHSPGWRVHGELSPEQARLYPI